MLTDIMCGALPISSRAITMVGATLMTIESDWIGCRVLRMSQRISADTTPAQSSKEDQN